MSALTPLNLLQTIYSKMVVFPQAIKDDTEFVGSKGSTPVTVDTVISGVKAEAARAVFGIGSIDATIAAMNIFQSDDDSTYTEIAGLDFVTDTTAPGTNDDNKLYREVIDLRTKKRYLQAHLTAGNGAAGTYAVCWFDLMGQNEAPTTAAGAGFADSLSA